MLVRWTAAVAHSTTTLLVLARRAFPLVPRPPVPLSIHILTTSISYAQRPQTLRRSRSSPVHTIGVDWWPTAFRL
uniref:Putative secreted protein n=1 Tax=Anopheles marajoara TaxID=58244 RepID=A0A2M4CD16_9DIPT